jgi:hypothetical protein
VRESRCAYGEDSGDDSWRKEVRELGILPPPSLPPPRWKCLQSYGQGQMTVATNCRGVCPSQSRIQAFSLSPACALSRAPSLSLAVALSICHLARTHARVRALSVSRALLFLVPSCRASRSIPHTLTGGSPQSRLPAAQLTARARHGQQTASAQWAGGKSGTAALEP